MNHWNTSAAPMDGKPIVAVGRIINVSPGRTVIAPFSAELSLWCLWLDDAKLSLTRRMSFFNQSPENFPESPYGGSRMR